MKKVALVTGGNRGIGAEVCRSLGAHGYFVLVGARDLGAGQKIVEQIKSSGGEALALQLDVNSPASIKEVREKIGQEWKRLDVLVNNAGIFPEESFSSRGLEASLDIVQEAIVTNVYGPLLLCQQFIPLMRKNKFGRIVNVSSGMGQLSHMGGGSVAYRISKASLNVITRVLAGETQGDNILINSVSPGWVRTDMGGPNANRGVDEGADSIVWLAMLPDGGPTGGFFQDRKPIAW